MSCFSERREDRKGFQEVDGDVGSWGKLKSERAEMTDRSRGHSRSPRWQWDRYVVLTRLGTWRYRSSGVGGKQDVKAREREEKRRAEDFEVDQRRRHGCG